MHRGISERMHIPHVCEHWSLLAIQSVKIFREVQISFAAYDIFRISATATSRVNVVHCEHMQGKLARNVSLVCAAHVLQILKLFYKSQCAVPPVWRTCTGSH